MSSQNRTSSALPARVGSGMFLRAFTAVVSLVVYTADVCLYALRRLLGQPGRRGTVIVTYHAIGLERRGRFESQMKMLVRAGRPVLAGDRFGAVSPHRRIAVTFDDGYQSVVENALPVMRRLAIPGTVFVTSGYLGQRPGWVHADHPYSVETVLSEGQLGKLCPDLVTIGSHTVTHCPLGDCSGDKLERELVQSRQTLERIVGSPVKLISLPYGSSSGEVLRACVEAGYDWVFLNVPSLRLPSPCDRVFGRVNMTLDESPLECWLKFTGAYRWISVAIGAKRLLLQVSRRLRTFATRRGVS
jgi:peptidoglycan/xylan/chitin deacetylase (PgdA/CDA1 family)